MKATLLAILVCLLSLTAFAAEGHDVTYQSGTETVHALLYMPSGTGPFPALVVIHEWWGLNDWVKQQASDYADKGYVTLASISIADKWRPRRTKHTRSCVASLKIARSEIC